MWAELINYWQHIICNSWARIFLEITWFVYTDETSKEEVINDCHKLSAKNAPCTRMIENGMPCHQVIHASQKGWSHPNQITKCVASMGETNGLPIMVRGLIWSQGSSCGQYEKYVSVSRFFHTIREAIRNFRDPFSCLGPLDLRIGHTLRNIELLGL